MTKQWRLFSCDFPLSSHHHPHRWRRGETSIAHARLFSPFTPFCARLEPRRDDLHLIPLRTPPCPFFALFFLDLAWISFRIFLPLPDVWRMFLHVHPSLPWPALFCCRGVVVSTSHNRDSLYSSCTLISLTDERQRRTKRHLPFSPSRVDRSA